MKRIFIFLLISIPLMLRFSFSTGRNIFQKNEIYKISLDLDDSQAKILKINDKYPFEHIYAKLFYKENGRYKGYFLIEDIKRENNFYFMTLKEIKSEKIEKNFAEKYLDKIFERAEDSFAPDLKNMNKAILLGDNNRLSKKIKQKIRYLGLSHIFAMSGLHIGIVFTIFYFTFAKILNKKLWIEITSLFLLSLYYLAVKESPSFTRAYIMIVIYILAKILYEKTNIEKTVFASIIISALLKPNSITSLSFQLSYLAVFAIIYFYPLIKKINIKKWKILDYILFTLSIQLFLIPLQIFYFGTMPFLSIIINILILPFASIYISLSYLHLFLENFYLGFILSPFVKFSYTIFIKIIDRFSELPYSVMNIYSERFIYFYFLFFIIILFKKKWNIFYKNLQIWYTKNM